MPGCDGQAEPARRCCVHLQGGGGGNNDLKSQIAGLAELRDQGILTDKEFKQKKAALLQARIDNLVANA